MSEPQECKCPCHNPGIKMMHIVPCCEGRCEFCGLWFKTGLDEHKKSHSERDVMLRASRKWIWVDTTDGIDEETAGIMSMARYVRDNVRADDDDIATLEWLEAIGGNLVDSPRGWYCTFRLRGEVKNTLLMVSQYGISVQLWPSDWWDAVDLVKKQVTKGDVRSLSKILNFVIKEVP